MPSGRAEATAGGPAGGASGIRPGTASSRAGNGPTSYWFAPGW